MPVNLDKVKQKQQEIEIQQNRQSNFRFWTPKSGSNKIRLLPPWSSNGPNADQFEREVSMHFNIGPNESFFICPRQTPKLPNPGDCPICDYVDSLRKSKDPSDMELASVIMAKRKYYSNIIDCDDPVYKQSDVDEWKANSKDPSRECPFKIGDTKIQIFSYGPQIYTQLINLFAELHMDLTDVEKGHDIIIKRDGKDRNTRYSSILCPVPRAVTVIHNGVSTKDIPLIDLDNAITIKKPEEMQAALYGTTPPALPSVSTGIPNVPPTVTTSAPPPSLPPTVFSATLPTTSLVGNAQAQVREIEDSGDDGNGGEEDGPPPCFKDSKVWSDNDPECVGGMKDGNKYTPCPFYKDCGIAVGKLSPEKPARRKRTPVSEKPKSDAEKLEEQMADALKS